VKYPILIGALAAMPFLIVWIRRNPGEKQKLWVLMGLLPFVLSAARVFEVALVPWPQWPGYVKGLEISALDLFALAIYLGSPAPRNPLPFSIAISFYFFALMVSVFQADIILPALFYPWQLARVFFIYAVVSRACADERVPLWLLTGMAAGLFLQAVFVVWQRYGLHAIQATGTFNHQNSLGLASHFVVFPLFALLLAGQPGWQPLLGPLSGAVVAIFTASRATIGLAGLGYAALFVLSVLRRQTQRKALIGLLGGVALIGLVPLAMLSLEQRFSAAPLADDYDERAAFVAAAAMMLSENPLGVGPNNYVVAANTKGYFDRAKVAPTYFSRSTNVHNVYWLAAAETGYLGLVAFVLVLLRPLTTAFICGWRYRQDRRGDLLLGLGMSLLVVYIHCFFEWIFVTVQVQYIFAITAGLVAGLAQQLGYWRHSPVAGAPLAATQPVMQERSRQA